MIYTIGIQIASHFFIRGDNEVSVLEDAVDGIDFCIDKPVWNSFRKKKKAAEVVTTPITIMSGTLADTTLETGDQRRLRLILVRLV